MMDLLTINDLPDLLPYLTPHERAEIDRLTAKLPTSINKTWPREYINRDKGRTYAPHHEAERHAVYDSIKRYIGFFGGEGSGKSTAGIVRDLNALRRGMNGILVAPDFEHFKRSLWPEFRRWVPWEMVVERERYRQSESWVAGGPFELHFNSEQNTISTLYCGGIEDPSGWEGPNVSFAHLDEIRRHRKADALKVLDGRVRIPGPHGEIPQLWVTTTPRKHWLFDYFGPLKDNDERAAFKADSEVVHLSTLDNELAGNLAQGYTQQRRQSLTEAEARVLLEAAWEDVDDAERFLSSMTLWDACRADLPPLSPHEPLVLAADAGVSNDSFGLIGVTAHPTQRGNYAARIIHEFKPPRGGKIDFRGNADAPGPDWLIRNVYAPKYAAVELVYDPYQLESLCSDLMRDGVLQCVPFPQGSDRLEADKFLYDMILARRIAHDGHAALRQHIDNANRKPDPESRKLRIVKREDSAKIDLAVTLSMAVYTAYRLGLGS